MCMGPGPNYKNKDIDLYLFDCLLTEEKYKAESELLEEHVIHSRRNVTIINNTIEQLMTAQTDIQMVTLSSEFILPNSI